MTKWSHIDIWDDDSAVLETRRILEEAGRRQYEALQRPETPPEASREPAAPAPPTRRQRIAALRDRLRSGDRSVAGALRALLDEDS